ncbi:biopolymer transport protein ExbB/TolQ [Roseibium hamelinense]|uniref:Biopolymer transport protein ExbB/TolQ n=1 Tax=Roseibium hamelinense TaxID=150831 RepID=A0A562SNW0_9HYPH|nr:MotA/TolQ/ExbB proton channel family protein [Roseibium hamelinense]MTI44275.1 MotA/TolQ/ExbB proton channel family protein [Roseibium hamelinense]TWI82952.1 biopolymer transport protein ExbB/TolQ [Roseibium hamelinense]
MTMQDISSLQDLLFLFHERGGWTLIVLVGLSVLTVATAFVNLIRVAGLKPFSSRSGACRELAQKIDTLAASGLDRRALADETSLIARSYLAKARSGTRLLELIITAAPLLGLLGTVLGMIDAFQAMQSAGDSVRPADLAGGIWEALITTAAGMIVALAALVLHSLIDAVAGNLKMILEQVATRSIAQSSVPLMDPATGQHRSSFPDQQSAA